MEYLFQQINMDILETYVETGIDDPCDFDEDEGISVDFVDVDFGVENPVPVVTVANVDEQEVELARKATCKGHSRFGKG